LQIILKNYLFILLLTLLISYPNVRSLNNKINNLRTQIPNSLHDIFVFIEIWFTSYIESKLGFHGYNVYRYDRNSNTSTLSKGCGILIAVLNIYTWISNLKIFVFNWKFNDYKSIINYLDSINWLSLFNSDINNNIDIF